jgi:cytochrome c
MRSPQPCSSARARSAGAHNARARQADAPLVRWALVILCVAVASCAQAAPDEQQFDPAMGRGAPPFSPGEWPASFGIGRLATEDEIRVWDIDIMPDGRGLPPGSGTVPQGEIVYRTKCAACHGATGTEGPQDRLIGREPEGFPFGTSAELNRLRTIGNYWPYATTVFDYVRRAMPQNAPGSLTADEVYAVTAYLLHKNGVIPADAIMDARTLPAVVMPARDRFVVDDRRGGPEIR